MNELCIAVQDMVKLEQGMNDGRNTLVRKSLLDEAQQEAVLGCLVNLASIKAPGYPKAHRQLAAFCYKWGKRVIETATKMGHVPLTDAETDRIKSYMRQVPWQSEQHLEENVTQVKDLIGRTQLIEYPEDLSDNTEHVPIMQQEEQVTVKLYKTFPWLYQYGQITAGLLQIWRMVSNRLFELYSTAAKSYFKFRI